MKKITITLSFVLTVFCCLNAQSQQHSSLNERTQSSKIIVEGKLIHQESFWNEDRKRILTKNQIKVFSTLKGTTSEIIEIVTHGGMVGDVFQIIPHVRKLELGEEGIFFCKYFTPKGMRNPVLMLNGSEGFLKYIKTGNRKIIVDVHGNRISQRQLQDMVLESVFEFNATFNSPENTTNLETIEFDFANIEFTQAATILEFDVLAKSSTPNLKFASGDIVIQYDTLPFGSNIVNNLVMETTKGTIIENSIYGLSTEDLESNIVKLQIDAKCKDNDFMYSLSSDFESLCHVKLALVNDAVIGQLSMDNFYMDGSVFYFDGQRQECLPFDEVFLPNPISPEIMPMIDTFFPNPITVGTGDILTIKGEMFGSSIGNVYFRNADDDGATMTRANTADIIWTDTMISVRMPTAPNAAGSGFFEVRTSANLSSFSTEWLDVNYGVLNVRTLDSLAHRLHLTGGPFDNILFFYEDTIGMIQNNFPIIDVINITLKKWQCETGVKWSLFGQSNFHTADPADGTNLIYFADTTEFTGDLSDLSAYNVLDGYRLQCNGQIRFYVRDIDIAIKETEPWVYDSTYNDVNINPSTKDFHSVLLHELGHGHKLSHVRELGKVMYYKLNTGQTRRILHPSDIEGGLNVIDSSQNLIGCLHPNGMENIIPIGQEFPPDCLTSIHEISSVNSLLIYPTIFDNHLNIELELNEPLDLKIRIFDILGREVLTKEYLKLSSGINNLNVNTVSILSNAMYFVQLELDNKMFSQKVFKLTN